MGLCILALSLVLQLIAAGMAIALVRTTRAIWAWMLVALALVLMTGRRAITLVAVIFGRAEADVSAELVALIISIAMLVGVALIRPVFTRMRDLAAELADREGKLRALIETAPDGIALVRDGECVYANAALVRVLEGAVHPGIAEIALFQRVHPDDRGAFLAPLESESDAAPVGTTREVRFRRGDGSYVPLELVYGPRLVHEGGEARMLQLRDLSERKKLEAQLVEAARMEAIGRLSGGIAHDFNNLLTVVVAALDLAQMKLGRGEDPTPELRAIDEASARAARLTGQLLAFARSQPVSPSAFDLNELVSATSHMLERVLREDVKLEIVLHPAGVPVIADQGQIEQVLMNLAINACDAMPHGGTLTFLTARVPDIDPATGQARVGERPAGEFAVKDEGCGLTPELKARIFEPFFTTKGVSAGTGLGLSSSLGIVSRAGGHIEVESEPGKGATFRVLLPGADAVAETGEVVRAQEADGGGERILLVEDEIELSRLAAQALRSRGYEVLAMESGEAALSALQADALRPDLLVTDVIMPSMDGTELARRVRALYPSLPILFMTGYGEHVLEKATDLGPLEVLRKPFAPSVLAGRIRSLLDARRANPAQVHAATGS